MTRQALRPARPFRLLALAGTLALVSTAACASNVSDGQKEAAKQDVTVKQLTTPKHRHLHGPVRVVIDATRTHADLSASQAEALSAIALDLQASHGDRRALGKKLKRTAIEVVRSGRTDSPEFAQSISVAVKAFEERANEHAAAVEEIHALLSPTQRAAVATALRAHIAEKMNAPREDKQRSDKRRDEGFKRFASQVMLSSLQLDKLKALKVELMGESEQIRPTAEELYALVDAFEGEDFRTALYSFNAKKMSIVQKRVARAGERTNSVLSIFTPEQRTLIADLIQDGPRKVLFGEEGVPAEPHAAAPAAE